MGLLGRFIGNLVGRLQKPRVDAPPAPRSDDEARNNGEMSVVDAMMRGGVSRHLAGDLDGAEVAYREVLKQQADHVDALQLLGSALGQRGRLDEARALLERAIELDPRHDAALVDLGNVHRASGSLDLAIEHYQRAITINSSAASAKRNLGYLYLEQGNEPEGLKHLQAAISLEPDVLQDQFTVAEILAQARDHGDAIPHYQKALALNPEMALAHNHLAFSMSACGLHDAAITHYEQAIALDPNDYVAHNDFGLLLQKLAMYDAAIEKLERTIEIKPEFAGGYLNLGNVHRDLRRFSKARECYQRALELEPDNPDAYNNLGTVLKDQGRVAEAVECVRRAIELRPGYVEAHSNLLLNLQYLSDVSIEELTEAHSEWVRTELDEQYQQFTDYRNTRDPHRLLRIGYVSPDFATHPVGLFMEPVLGAHDESQVRVICYDDLYKGDVLTERLKLLSDKWRPIAGLSDEKVAEMIRDDGIDILIDLAGHTANNRMRLFARKPAPVQATWIGYLHSTGLEQMDYLIADPVVVPEDSLQRFSEEVIRLPHCFLCHGQPTNTPEVAPPPALERGYVNFGCYNNLAKVSSDALELWHEVLERTPKSRLLLKNSAFNDADTRKEYLNRLQSVGFSTDRITLEGSSAHGEYFQSFARIDIALDPFPFSGGTISADALWMGVPVVTLAGDRMASRTSASILICLGLDSLVTSNPEAYADAAVALASNVAGLASLRAGMRQRFSETDLGNPPTFTGHLEAVYRLMWREWCRSGKAQR